VTNVLNVRLVGLPENEIDGSRYIVEADLVKGKVPINLIALATPPTLLRVYVAPGIEHPDVKALPVENVGQARRWTELHPRG